MTKEVELAYWINERHQMRRRKESPGVVPPGHWKYGWSGDRIMGTTRWCNVHREDDKVTRWLAQHWRPTRHAVWEIVLARMVNYIPALEELCCAPEHWGDLDLIKRVLKTRRGDGEKVFTSAYTISTCGKSMDKIDYVVDWVVKNVREIFGGAYNFTAEDTLEKAFEMLTHVDGLGSFLAGQVLADLKNTPGHPLQKAPDWWTWACPGPGSLRGLEAFYGYRIIPRTFANALQMVEERTLPLLDKAIPRISMQDWQNCMCEFSKYMKLKEGRGHARNRYPGNN